MKVWILTSEYNEYDQQGEYFEGVFAEKPTSECLQTEFNFTEAEAAQILSGGGREGEEYSWYLREHDI